MKKIIISLCILLTSFVLTSCSENTMAANESEEVTIKIKTPIYVSTNYTFNTYYSLPVNFSDISLKDNDRESILNEWCKADVFGNDNSTLVKLTYSDIPWRDFIRPVNAEWFGQPVFLFGTEINCIVPKEDVKKFIEGFAKDIHEVKIQQGTFDRTVTPQVWSLKKDLEGENIVNTYTFENNVLDFSHIFIPVLIEPFEGQVYTFEYDSSSDKDLEETLVSLESKFNSYLEEKKNHFLTTVNTEIEPLTKELIKGKDTDFDKSEQIINYVLDNFEIYDPYTDTNTMNLDSFEYAQYQNIKRAWEDKKVVCVEQTYIMKLMFDIAGIKNKIIYSAFEDKDKNNETVMHVHLKYYESETNRWCDLRNNDLYGKAKQKVFEPVEIIKNKE